MNLDFSAAEFLSSFFSLAAVFIAAWLAFGYEKRKVALDKHLSACRDLYILLTDLKDSIPLRKNRNAAEKLMPIAIDLAIAGNKALSSDVTKFMSTFNKCLDSFEEALTKSEEEEANNIQYLMELKGFTKEEATAHYHRDILKEAPISSEAELDESIPFRHLLVSDKSIDGLMNKVEQQLKECLQFKSPTPEISHNKRGVFYKPILFIGIVCILFLPAILQVVYSIPLFESKISAESSLAYYSILVCASIPAVIYLAIRR